MREAIAALVREYRFNPGALVNTLEGLYKTHLTLLERKTEEEIAQRVCERRHPAGCGQVVCKACHDAILAKYTGDDRPMTDEDF